MLKIILMIAAATIGGLFLMTKFDPNAGNNNIVDSGNNSTDSNNSTNMNRVTISGEVNHPGEYEIDSEQTLQYLIDLAGGVTEDADPDSYVSTLVIGKRTNFYIPSGVKIPDSCIVEKVEKVNINTASLEELQNIGFKSNQAENLISYRKENGNFECIEDILEVSGIGDATYTKLRELITLR